MGNSCTLNLVWLHQIAPYAALYEQHADVPPCPADVLEWAWYLNSFGKDGVYKFMWGDKDSFGVAFAMAGKAHMYQQVNVPPGMHMFTRST